jgi:hypothetical protein
MSLEIYSVEILSQVHPCVGLRKRQLSSRQAPYHKKQQPELSPWIAYVEGTTQIVR